MSDTLLAELPECPVDSVLMDESSYSTDINEFVRHLALQGVSADEFKDRIIQWVADSPDRSTYGDRQREALWYLKTPKRTFQRWVKDFCDRKETPKEHSRGDHELTQYWKPFIIDTWKEGNKDGQTKTIQDVWDDMESEAFHRRGGKEIVSYSTVYRNLKPLIEQKKLIEGARSAGQKDRCVIKTRQGKALQANWSNEVVVADSTLIDLFTEYEGDEEVLGYRIVRGKDQEIPPSPDVFRLWLTIVKDLKSTCVLGFILNAKHPSADDIALLIRRVIRPKNFPPDYEMQNTKIPHGRFKHLHTDGGKYLNCEYLHQIAENLKFACHLRMRTEDGGDVETMFNILRYLFSKWPGYTNSNTQKRPKGAEERACLKPRDVDKLLTWFFYGIFNHEVCQKHETMTRYKRWLNKLPGQQLPVEVPEEELNCCLTRATRRKVQRKGIVNFGKWSYYNELLKSYVGKDVLLRYDPDDILRMTAFSLKDDKQGNCLGTVVMLPSSIEKLNEYIQECELDIPEINLETGSLSFDELEKINEAVKEKSKKADASTKASRLGFRKKINDHVTTRKKNKQSQRRERQRLQNSKLRSAAKKSTKSKASNSINKQPSKPSVSQAPNSANESVGSSEQKATAEDTTQPQEAISQGATSEQTPPPLDGVKPNEALHTSSKVVDIQERIQEKAIEVIREKVNSGEIQRPKMVIPHWKRNSR